MKKSTPKTQLQSYLLEIEKALSLFPKRTSSQNPEAYIGGGQSQLRYLGLRVPHLNQTMRQGFSFSHQDPAELAGIWDYVWWHSDCYEVMSLALAWFYDPKRRSLLAQNWPKLKEWSNRIDNWAHADTLSGIYARLHEDLGLEVFSTFKVWNSSQNPWLRRLSLVSLFYYSSMRKKYPSFNKVISLIKPQLEYDHYYVQKAVGWTLRETGNVYPDQTYEFLVENVLTLSSSAFSAATEKLTPAQKEHLKKRRKKIIKSVC
jgi:3-methyladenine DNA glycosylase AlkD